MTPREVEMLAALKLAQQALSFGVDHYDHKAYVSVLNLVARAIKMCDEDEDYTDTCNRCNGDGGGGEAGGQYWLCDCLEGE